MEQTNKNQNQSDGISSPSLEVDIRTMEGDIRALKETGGETTGIKGEKENISRQDGEKSEISKFAVSSDNFIFPQSQKSNQPVAKTFEPAPSNIESVKVAIDSGDSEKNPVWKTLLIILSILVLAAGFGVLGYYLSPLIFK